MLFIEYNTDFIVLNGTLVLKIPWNEMGMEQNDMGMKPYFIKTYVYQYRYYICRFYYFQP